MTLHALVIACGYLAWGVIATAAITCSLAVMTDAVRTEWRRHRTRALDRAELAARNRALQVTGTVHHLNSKGRS